MNARLPIPGGDDGDWGTILNTFLQVAHNSDGTLQSNAISDAGAALTTNNLSDLQSAAVARTNLGLGSASLLSNSVGGDLSGSLPSPTVAKVNSVSVSGTPSSGQVLTASNGTAATWATPATYAPAANYNLVAWTMDPLSPTGNNSIDAQTLTWCLAYCYTSTIVNYLGTQMVQLGFGPGSGINAMAIATLSGQLLGQTGDMSDEFNQAEVYVEGQLTESVQLTAGTAYYIGILTTNYTGGDPAFVGSQTYRSFCPIRGVYPSICQTGITEFPASFTPSAYSVNSCCYFMTAGS